MKDFFKNVAATIVGLFAFGLIMTILGFICIIGMVASQLRQRHPQRHRRHQAPPDLPVRVMAYVQPTKPP